MTRTQTKLIWFAGGATAVLLAAGLSFSLIQSGNGLPDPPDPAEIEFERGSGRDEERIFLVAEGKTQEKGDKDPQKGSGRKD